MRNTRVCRRPRRSRASSRSRGAIRYRQWVAGNTPSAPVRFALDLRQQMADARVDLPRNAMKGFLLHGFRPLNGGRITQAPMEERRCTRKNRTDLAHPIANRHHVIEVLASDFI